MFLFGGRQTGKSTLLKERFPKAVYIDLLKSDVRNRFKQHPEEFRESLLRYPPETLVIVDEIQKVPDLLDEVHWLMVEKGLWFILSGSSALKIKRSGANNLGGRAIPETLFPLVSAEIPDFDRERCVMLGDSLTSDIRGGINAGVKTCWFNPKRRPNPGPIQPDYEIHELSEFPPLLETMF